MAKTIILVSGVADLMTAIAALRVDGVWSEAHSHKTIAVIIGQRVSLPENLVGAFREVAANSFGLSDIKAFRWGEDNDAIDKFIDIEAGADILAANQLQDSRQRGLIAALKPRQFMFYDNGLSSYASHDIDINSWIAGMPECRRFAAYLSCAREFGVPPYLRAFAVASLTPDALKKSAHDIRKACVSRQDVLSSNAVVILGTSFDRTNIISADEEHILHKQMIDAIRKQQGGPYFFKPHPRANQAYLADEDDVKTLPTELPVEVYISGSGGTAYSFSSTALFTLPMMFGWRAYRVAHPLMEKVFRARPQLAKISVMSPSFELENLDAI